MKELSLLKQYASKVDGQSFPASEWNGFVNDVIASCRLHAASLSTHKVEKLVEEVWTDVTTSGYSFEAGGVYRLSGYFTHKVSFVEGQEEPATSTKVILNDCCIVTDEGACIDYAASKKTMQVVINPGTENYLIQTSESGDYLKKGALNSEKNMDITGAGVLYLENAVGHGAKASELNLRGKVSVLVKAAHDGFHGSQILNIYNGDYYILDAKDAFGGGVRDEGEETKMRGIIRIFCGNIHVYGVRENIFDAKYDKMQLGDDDLYYSEDDVIPGGVTIIQTWNSGFHSFHYVVDGPAITASNLESGHFQNNVPTAAAASVMQAGQPLVPDANGIYTAAAGEVIITGYVKGVILCPNQSTEVHLNHAILEAPITEAMAEVDSTLAPYVGVAIKYTASKKNIQIQSDGGSEGNFIFGKIDSANNVKITPKGDSILFIDSVPNQPQKADSIGVFGSTVVYNNGGGSIYITGFAQGTVGSEQWIGNDDTGEAGKELKGDLYVFGNYAVDIHARLNSTFTKKGFFHVTSDFAGYAFAGIIKPTLDIAHDSGDTGVIVGESLAAGKLFYEKNIGASVVTKDAAVRHAVVDGNELISRLG